MSTHLQMEYTRNVTTDVSGNEVFRILSECVDPGQISNGTGLPDKGVFLYSIFNSRNTNADEFERVCSINDLETYASNRDEAIANNDSYWRSYTLTRDYDKLTTGVQAVTVIADRINVLVNDYASYIGDFKTDPAPEDKAYPTSDPTYVTELKTTYDTKVSDYEDTVAAHDAAETARDDAVDAVSASQDTLSEWQEVQDKVCGGDVSGSGNEFGLSPYVSEVSNAFKNLFDNTGAVPHYDTNTVDVKNAMDAFIALVEGVQTGSISTVRLTVQPGSTPISTDIGKAVVATGGGNGRLISYDADNDYWWVGDVDGGDWTGTVTITAGSPATGTISASVVSAGNGPLDGLPLLEASRDALDNTLDTVRITDGILSTAADALTDATATCAYVTSVTTQKATDVVSAENSLKTKETAYIESISAMQAAYNEVVDAYTAVKNVCPSWSPVPPLPAAP